MKGSRIKSVEEMWEKICFDSIKSLRPSIKFTYIRDDGFEVESDMTNWLSCEVSPEEKNVLNEAEGVVVDLACGFGKHLLYISSVNNKIERLIGIEISKRIVDYNQRHNLEMICGDMCVFVEME